MMISKMNTQMNTQISKMNTQMSWHDRFRLRGSSAEDGVKAAALAKKQEPAECNLYAQILNLQTYGAPPLSRMRSKFDHPSE